MSTLWLKIIGVGAAALMILLLVMDRNHQRSLAKERGDKLATICTATRAASNNPKLKCAEMPVQIGFMGEAIGTLTRAVDKQNAAVDAMGVETKRQQSDSARAAQAARERAGRAEATAARLTASSRAGGAVARPCEPSETLKESWR